jgi:endonuclease YncB( thermonuclease family)
MRDKKYNRGEKNFTKWAIREEGKGIQRLADQNAQIPPGMNVEENKKLSHLNRWSKNYEKQRAFRLSRRNKKT